MTTTPPGTIRNIRHFLDNHILPDLKDRPVDKITGSEIEKMFNKVWKAIPATAGQAWSITRNIFDHCIVDVYIEENESPVNDRIYKKLRKPKHRTTNVRSVPHHRIRWAVDVIRRYTVGRNIAVKLCLLVVILTACRPSEATQMKWGELRWKKIEDDYDWGEAELNEDGDFIDQWEVVDWDEFERGRGTDKTIVWFIPKEHAKKRRPHRTPLSGDAIDIIWDLRPLHDRWGVDYVFPQDVGDHSHITTGSLRRLCNRLNLPGKPHGFRTTCSTWCASVEVPSYVKELVLAHVIGDPVVRAYLRADLLQIRARVMDLYAQYVRGDLPKGWKWAPEGLAEEFEVLQAELARVREEREQQAKQIENLTLILTELTVSIQSESQDREKLTEQLAALNGTLQDALENLRASEASIKRLETENAALRAGLAPVGDV